VPELPRFIPVLEAGLPKGLILPPGELYGVGLRTVVSEHGRLKTRSGARLRSLLRLPPNARLCLSCSCDDRRIEKLWERCLELDTWRGIAELRFEFVTGMTFSVWADRSILTSVVPKTPNAARAGPAGPSLIYGRNKPTKERRMRERDLKEQSWLQPIETERSPYEEAERSQKWDPPFEEDPRHPGDQQPFVEPFTEPETPPPPPPPPPEREG
jgi:hypothetical protein